MEKFYFIPVSILLLVLASCGSSKKVATTSKSLEGNKVLEETVEITGLEMVEALNEDGTKIIKVPYKWYLGRGTSENKQFSIEKAQRDAYATISRVMQNVVDDEAEKATLEVESKVRMALNSHWKQVSQSILKGAEPFGEVKIQFNPDTKLYESIAKVGIRGDKYKQLLRTSTEFNTEDLDSEELDNFLELHDKIMQRVQD